MKGIIFILLGAVLLTSCSSNTKEASLKKKAFLFYSHGTEKLIEKDYTEALKNLIKANQLMPNDTKILNNLAMAYYFKGRKTQATQLLTQSLEIDGKNADARNNLASIYFNQGKLDIAEKEYKKVLDNLLYKNNFRVYYNLGLIEKRKNNLEEAIVYFNKASGLRIDYCASNYELAITYRQVKKFNKSLEWFKQATKEKCGDNPLPLYEWGKTLASIGQNAKAVEIFSQVSNKFPQDKLSFKAERRIKLLSKQQVLTNKYDKIETFNSQDF